MENTESKAVNSAEVFVNKSMREFETEIYGKTGRELLQYSRDRFDIVLENGNGEELSPKSKKWILKAIREVAEAYFKGDAKDLDSQAKDELAASTTEASKEEESEPPLVVMEIGTEVFISRRATELEQETSGISWISNMSANVGKKGTIIGDHRKSGGDGFEVEIENSAAETWAYPTCVLEIYDPEKHDQPVVEESKVDYNADVPEEEQPTVHSGAGTVETEAAPTPENDVEEAAVEPIENPQKLTIVEDEKGHGDGNTTIVLHYTNKRNLNEQLYNLIGAMVWCNIFTSHRRLKKRVTAALTKKGFAVKALIRQK